MRRITSEVRNAWVVILLAVVISGSVGFLSSNLDSDWFTFWESERTIQYRGPATSPVDPSLDDWAERQEAYELEQRLKCLDDKASGRFDNFGLQC